MMIQKLLTITILLLALSSVLPPTAQAQDPLLAERPHWSAEFKAGLFYPDIDNWEDYYGEKFAGRIAASIAYKLSRQFEIGFEAGYIRDEGKGFAPIHGQFTGEVSYELYPLQAFALFRAVFSERQWIVPYFGGGPTRIYYRQKVELQDTVKGSTDGYHARAGIQLLLDEMDREAAGNMYEDYGVFNTYAFMIEVQYIDADIETTSGTINLGGTSVLVGILFEF